MDYLKVVWRHIFSHLLFFYAGAIVFIQLDIWYWTPNEGISPASFTAGASTITLLLALLALAKVNKWFDDKVKDKKFDKAHSFFEKMAEMYVSISRLNALVTNLPTEKGLMKTTLFLEGLQDIKAIRKEAVELIIEVAAINKHFTAMGIVFHYGNSLDKYLEHCVFITKEAFTMCTFLENRELPNLGRISGEFEEKFDQAVIDCRLKIKQRYYSCNYIGEAFLKMKFKSMFELVDN